MNTCRIMLVDDEVDYLSTLVKRMKKRNMDVCAVNSGEEALQRLEKDPVDCVVLDVRMPGMDGLQALKEIKARYPQIEVILLTGHANVEVAIQGIKLGAFDYLMKPVDIDELLYKVQDAFKRKTIQEAKHKRITEVAEEDK